MSNGNVPVPPPSGWDRILVVLGLLIEVMQMVAAWFLPASKDAGQTEVHRAEEDQQGRQDGYSG